MVMVWSKTRFHCRMCFLSPIRLSLLAHFRTDMFDKTLIQIDSDTFQRHKAHTLVASLCLYFHKWCKSFPVDKGNKLTPLLQRHCPQNSL